jgi:hypothetical protein
MATWQRGFPLSVDVNIDVDPHAPCEFRHMGNQNKAKRAKSEQSQADLKRGCV